MRAFNFITQTEYAGRNALIKGNSHINGFATFVQIKNAGYKLNKGSKGYHIFCGFKSIDQKNSKGKIVTVTVPKSAIVFDIADTDALNDNKLIKQLEHIKPNMQTINAELVAAIFE